MYWINFKFEHYSEIDIASCVRKHKSEEVILVLKFQYCMYVWNLILKLSSLSTPRGRKVHACTPRSVERGANNTPCHQAPRQVHATTAHVSKAFPSSPRGANSGRTCTTSSGDGGGWNEYPHPPSTVTARYDTPVPHVSPSINPD